MAAASPPKLPACPFGGGATDDLLQARAGDDNSIYGGGGIDTVLFTGNFSDYTLLSWQGEGAEMSLEGVDVTNYLHGISYLQFDDQLIATTALPEPSTVLLAGSACILFFLLSRRRRQP